MPESHDSVYRDLSVEMHDGLRNIYQQISNASAAGKDPGTLFNDASVQLEEVVRETESATMDIMEIVEKQLAQTERISAVLAALRHKFGDDPDLELLRHSSQELSRDLTAVLTALSFQDITGQRIRKVLQALGALENNVVELYLSSGLVIEAADRNPHREAGEIREEARKAVEDYRENRGSELKGPDKNGVSQAAIDDMLAQLGL